MDLMLIFIIAGVSILVSFCCSILEAGLFSITRSRIETLRRQGDPRGETLAKLRQHIDESIAAILIVNTIAHTIGAAWAGALVRELYDSFALGVFSAVFTFAILFFSEIIPKSLGVRYAAFLAPLFALPLQIMTWSLWPMVKICVLATRLWGKGHGASDSSEEDIIWGLGLGCNGVVDILVQPFAPVLSVYVAASEHTVRDSIYICLFKIAFCGFIFELSLFKFDFAYSADFE